MPHIRAPLPKNWPRSVKLAMLNTISLAQFALAHTRGWAANCQNARVRQKAELDQASQEDALLREQLRIHIVRMERIPAHRRPKYPPTERMAILELKAARGWSLEQTANAFLVTAATVSSWMRRLDEDGPDALVQLPMPVNKFPDYTRYIVQRLKALCPTMGKVKIAQTLARAGLHLGATTVGRILGEKPQPTPNFDGHGSIAVVERVILTIKGLLSCLSLVPYRRETFLRELTEIAAWYNESRPHTWLGGKTPDEVYQNAFPANRKPRFEPRLRWPRGSPCAKPWALVRGSPGEKLTLEVGFTGNRKHLPVVTLKRAG